MNELRSKSGGFRDAGKKSGRSRAESSLRGSVLRSSPSAPFRCSVTHRASRLNSRFSPNRGERGASICVILCYLPVWQPASNAAVSRSLLLFRRALYIPCTAAHSYFRVVRTGCNPRIISNRPEFPLVVDSARLRNQASPAARRPRRR